MSSITRHQVFGKDDRPTIYYLVGFKSTISRFRWHIKLLAKAGFRVVAFEYEDSILESGNPGTLIDELKHIVSVISADKRNRKVAGVYGISLGSWLGLNVLIMCNIKSAIFLTGGERSMAEVLWSKPLLLPAKQNFQKNGYTKKDLHKFWDPHDFQDPSRVVNKRLMLLDSTNDEVISADNAIKTVNAWHKTSPEVQLKIYKRYSHAGMIARGLIDLRSAINFLRESV